jgi:hypothetical protein
LPEVAELFNKTLSPEQKVNAPTLEMRGVEGIGFTVTTTLSVSEQPLVVPITW